MDWLFLFLAIVFEIFGTCCLKVVSLYNQPIFYIGVAIGYIAAFIFFGYSMKGIEVSVAYAVWSGIGIVGTSFLGILLFNETLSKTQFLYIVLIVLGVIGLNLSTKT